MGNQLEKTKEIKKKVEKAAQKHEEAMDKIEELSEAKLGVIEAYFNQLNESVELTQNELQKQLDGCRMLTLKPINMEEAATRTTIQHLKTVIRTNKKGFKDVQLNLHLNSVLTALFEKTRCTPVPKHIIFSLPEVLAKAIGPQPAVMPLPSRAFYTGYPPISRDATDISTIKKSVNVSDFSHQGIDYMYSMTIHPITQEVYITCSNSGTVLILDPELNFKRLVSPSSENFPNLKAPRGIAVSLNGTIAIVSNGDSTIRLLDSNMENMKVIGRKNPNSPSSFYYPQSVAFDTKGNLYISDGANRQMQMYREDGTFVCVFGGAGAIHPVGWAWGITITDDDNIVVAAEDENHLHVYNTKPEFLSRVPIDRVTGSEHLCRGKSGGYVVTNRSKSTLQFFDRTGVLVHSTPAEKVSGIAFGAHDRLYVILSDPPRVAYF